MSWLIEVGPLADRSNATEASPQLVDNKIQAAMLVTTEERTPNETYETISTDKFLPKLADVSTTNDRHRLIIREGRVPVKKQIFPQNPSFVIETLKIPSIF